MDDNEWAIFLWMHGTGDAMTEEKQHDSHVSLWKFMKMVAKGAELRVGSAVWDEIMKLDVVQLCGENWGRIGMVMVTKSIMVPADLVLAIDPSYFSKMLGGMECFVGN